jgi:hypothetical protein
MVYDGYFWKFDGKKTSDIFWCKNKDDINELKYDEIFENECDIKKKLNLSDDEKININVININNYYHDLIYKIERPLTKPEFNSGGKLIIALFEWRKSQIKNIHAVINAILNVYDRNEIGFAIVYGKNNCDQIESEFGDWKNILLIKTNDYNHNHFSYSKRLYTPELWEHFKAWSHVLVYQWDALILRKIPEKYFKYDYIGAPIHSCPRCGGNGGFSLRNVKKMIERCEKYRGNYENIYNINEIIGHEDGYFGNYEDISYKKPEIFSDEHKEFAIESMYIDNPVGLHKVFHWFQQGQSSINCIKLFNNMKDKLINNGVK